MLVYKQWSNIMIKTGIESTGYFGAFDYEEGLKKCKEHGYDCIDYENLVVDADAYVKFSDEEYSDYLKKMKKAADSAGIEIFQAHGSTPLTEDKVYKEVDERFLRQLYTCKELGCKHLVLHPYSDGIEYFETHEVVMKKNYDLMELLLPYAEKYGVILCLENLPFRYVDISRVVEIKKLIKNIGSKNLGACLDTGHTNVINENIYDSVITFGEDLKTLHVHDNFGYSGDRHYPPYKGTVDWEGFIKGLNDIGYKGCMSLETFIDRRTPEPMKEMMQKGLAGIAKYFASQVK